MFEQMYKQHSGEFELLALASHSAKEPVPWMQQSGYTFPWGLDGDWGDMYGVHGIPHTFFINREGEVVDEHLGEISAEEFEAKLAEITR